MRHDVAEYFPLTTYIPLIYGIWFKVYRHHFNFSQCKSKLGKGNSGHVWILLQYRDLEFSIFFLYQNYELSVDRGNHLNMFNVGPKGGKVAVTTL